MSFRDSIKENLWFGVLNYEYERHVRDQLLQGLADGWLDWLEMSAATDADKEKYIKEQATPFICLSIRQSKELFAAAEGASDATRPLLSYYAMMNLAKGLLAIDIPDYFQDKANLMHGMTTRYGDKYKFNFGEEKIVLLPKGVYSFARKALGMSPICGPKERACVKLSDAFKGLPDLYTEYIRLGKIEPRDMNTFHFGIPEQQWDSYEQKFYVHTFVDSKVYDEVKDRFIVDLPSKFMFEGASFGQVHLKSTVKSALIRDLQKMLDEFSTMLMTANNRHIPLKFQCAIEADGSPIRHEQIAFTDAELIYILMFYMSTLARYRPHIWEAAISGKETEFVTLFKRFLYYADGKFIGLTSGRVAQLNERV